MLTVVLLPWYHDGRLFIVRSIAAEGISDIPCVLPSDGIPSVCTVDAFLMFLFFGTHRGLPALEA